MANDYNIMPRSAPLKAVTRYPPPVTRHQLQCLTKPLTPISHFPFPISTQKSETTLSLAFYTIIQSLYCGGSSFTRATPVAMAALATALATAGATTGSKTFLTT